LKRTINDLRNGMRNVDLEAKVIEKAETKEVTSRQEGTKLKVVELVIKDSTGTFALNLWNEQIDKVNVDDLIRIENGYVSSFKGELQLNVGRYGRLFIAETKFTKDDINRIIGLKRTDGSLIDVFKLHVIIFVGNCNNDVWNLVEEPSTHTMWLEEGIAFPLEEFQYCKTEKEVKELFNHLMREALKRL